MIALPYVESGGARLGRNAFSTWEDRMPLGDGSVMSKVKIEFDRQAFFIGSDEPSLVPVGPVLDASILSDKTDKGEGASFAANLVGVSAQDLMERKFLADFSEFNYRCQSDADRGAVA